MDENSIHIPQWTQELVDSMQEQLTRQILEIQQLKTQRQRLLQTKLRMIAKMKLIQSRLWNFAQKVRKFI